MKKLQLFIAVPLLLLSAFSVYGGRAAVAAPAQQAAKSWSLLVGQEIFTKPGEKSTWQDLRFFADTITINAGDTVTWKQDSGLEPHTVTFLGSDNKAPNFALPECNGAPCPPPPPGAAPGPPPPGITFKLQLNPMVALRQGPASYDGSTYVNSGVMASDIPGPRDYSLTFTKPGTYNYLCALHGFQLPDGSLMGMSAKVVVQPAGSALPMTQAQVTEQGKAMLAADEKEALSLEATIAQNAVTSKPGPNGTSTYHVDVSHQMIKGNYTLDYLRFAPSDITINEGDTIEWSSPTPNSFHNVLFGEEPEALLIEPQKAGPPKVYANLDVFGPVGPNPATYAGSGVASSGILVGAQDPPDLGTKSYSVSFTQAGRYEYVCGLHYHNGMDGRVIVRNRTGGATPGMPSTGSSSGLEIALASLAALIIGLAGLALKLKFRSRPTA